METNKFYAINERHIRIIFLIYNDKGIGVEFDSKTGKYFTGYWSDYDTVISYQVNYKVDLTQPMRDVIQKIFRDGNLYL